VPSCEAVGEGLLLLVAVSSSASEIPVAEGVMLAVVEEALLMLGRSM
jgi:hypothetical protein